MRHATREQLSSNVVSVIFADASVVVDHCSNHDLSSLFIIRLDLSFSEVYGTGIDPFRNSIYFRG